jgi:hypothetical protein
MTLAGSSFFTVSDGPSSNQGAPEAGPSTVPESLPASLGRAGALRARAVAGAAPAETA